jgi:hypothetical protein
MLTVYHIKVRTALRVREQGRENSQRFEVDVGGVNHLPRPADFRVEHPVRDLQSGEPRSVEGRAPDHGQALPAARGLDPDLTPIPRMPPVAHFPHVGIVGALSLACTTRAGRTRPLTARRRVWSTLSRCPSVRQRNVNLAEHH